MSDIPTVKLANGVEMPVLSVGLANWVVKKGQIESNPRFTGFLPEECYRATQLALETGHRCFDTALVGQPEVEGKCRATSFVERGVTQS